MYRQDLNTSSGMWALWDYDTYKDVDDYDKWEPLFCEDADIEKQISRKSFVPITIHEDGCFAFTLKVNEGLNEREQKYLCVKSEEYLFYTSGKTVLSGIDYIDASVKEKDAIILNLPEGHYSVVICLLSWDEEPGAYLEDGSISPDALSDFVVLVKPAEVGKQSYRNSVETFEE